MSQSKPVAGRMLSGFNQALGIHSIVAENGESSLQLDVCEQHLNSGGIVHGGVLASLLDIACGAAIFSAIAENKFAPTTTMSINYIASVSEGRLTASARLLKMGKRVVHCEAQVHCGDTLLTQGQTSFIVVENRLIDVGKEDKQA